MREYILVLAKYTSTKLFFANSPDELIQRWKNMTWSLCSIFMQVFNLTHLMILISYLYSIHQSFTSRLAAKHYERRQMTRVWAGWHSIIEAKWRQRVEKACQGKAQEVCMQLTNDYETQIASVSIETMEVKRGTWSFLATVILWR